MLRRIYILLLVLLGIGMTTSSFASNLCWVLLLVVWCASGHWREKWQRMKESSLLQFWVVLFLLHVVGLMWSENVSYALFDIQKKLPLIAVPMVVLTERPLGRKELRMVLGWYMTAVFVVSVIGVARYLTIPDLPYRKIVPYISHIRFALNICMAIVIAFGSIASRMMRCDRRRTDTVHLVVLCAYILWLGCFLWIIRSYTGILILMIVVPAMLLMFGRKKLSRKVFVGALVSVAVIYVVLGVRIVVLWQDYYRLQPIATAPLRTETAEGGIYTHACDGFIENGNYVNNYLCDEELERSWPERSQRGLQELTPNGYSVYSTLVRYLNACGQPKDAEGVASLREDDVRAIEQGVANPVYIEGAPLRKMVYVMIFERECARFHSIKDHSVLQRLALWQNGWKVSQAQPLIGTGTGDVVDRCTEQLRQDQSPLAEEGLHIHNQYLTLLVTFGWIGIAVLAVLFIRVVVRSPLCHKPYYVAHLLILMLSFVTEDTLETLAGILFAVFFASLFGSGAEKTVTPTHRDRPNNH